MLQRMVSCWLLILCSKGHFRNLRIPAVVTGRNCSKGGGKGQMTSNVFDQDNWLLIWCIGAICKIHLACQKWSNSMKKCNLLLMSLITLTAWQTFFSTQMQLTALYSVVVSLSFWTVIKNLVLKAPSHNASTWEVKGVSFVWEPILGGFHTNLILSFI